MINYKNYSFYFLSDFASTLRTLNLYVYYSDNYIFNPNIYESLPDDPDIYYRKVIPLIRTNNAYVDHNS